jgi:hypothetical protein
MNTDTITADDTLTLFDRVIVDLADGDLSTITFPNDMTNMKTGKRGNTIYAKNETGKNAELNIRVIMGSADDRFFQGKLLDLERDFVSFELATGEFVKRVGDGQGNVVRNVYTMGGGIFIRRVDAKDNAEGDTEQGVSIYRMKFARAERIIQ